MVAARAAANPSISWITRPSTNVPRNTHTPEKSSAHPDSRAVEFAFAVT